MRFVFALEFRRVWMWVWRKLIFVLSLPALFARPSALGGEVLPSHRFFSSSMLFVFDSLAETTEELVHSTQLRVLRGAGGRLAARRLFRIC